MKCQGMNLKYFFSFFFIGILVAGCATTKAPVLKDDQRPTRSPDQADLQAFQKPPAEETGDPLRELKEQLLKNGVPEEWLDRQLRDETFRLEPNIGHFFQQSAEKQTDLDKKRDLAWYFARMDVDGKIEKGKFFMERHGDLLRKAEAKNGIPKELIAAIIGLETNFADRGQRGNFHAFNVLVSQYLFTNRKKFAVRELTALYLFSQRTGRPVRDFTSSYAGAIGWGQFIPSSLLSFFIDADGQDDDIDPFAIDDTIFSVENYLHKNNLSGGNIHDSNSLYRAVYAYNHSDAYVKAVLYIYEGLKKHSRPRESGDDDFSGLSLGN